MKNSDLHAEAIRVRKSHEASIEWIERYRAGDPVAGSVLVIAHLPMVMSIAQRFTRVATRDWEDIIQEGRMGVLRGAETYDRTKGLPSTHLWQWVRSRMGRYVLNHVEIIRRPVHLYKKNAKDGGEGARTWKPLARMFTEMLLDSHVDGDPTFEDRFLDEHLPADEELAERDHDLACRRLAPWLLFQIGPRERKILQRRFGLLGGGEKTLQEIGDELGVTRERIRQLEDEALDACWGVVPPGAHETFEAWVSRALGEKDRQDAIEAERVGFMAARPVVKVIRRRPARERGAA